MKELYVVLIDDKGYWDIPNIDAIESIYMHDYEALGELYAAYNSGIYEMEILETDDFEGQMGDYGQWECAPYHCITDICMNKIGNISKDWKSNSQKKALLKQSLEDRLLSLSKNLPDGLLLQPHWGNTIIFASKDTSSSWMIKPIKQFNNILTEENVSYIEKSVKYYLDYGFFDDNFTDYIGHDNDVGKWR